MSSEKHKAVFDKRNFSLSSEGIAERFPRPIKISTQL